MKSRLGYRFPTDQTWHDVSRNLPPRVGSGQTKSGNKFSHSRRRGAGDGFLYSPGDDIGQTKTYAGDVEMLAAIRTTGRIVLSDAVIKHGWVAEPSLECGTLFPLFVHPNPTAGGQKYHPSATSFRLPESDSRYSQNNVVENYSKPHAACFAVFGSDE